MQAARLGSARLTFPSISSRRRPDLAGCAALAPARPLLPAALRRSFCREVAQEGRDSLASAPPSSAVAKLPFEAAAAAVAAAAASFRLPGGPSLAPQNENPAG